MTKPNVFEQLKKIPSFAKLVDPAAKSFVASLNQSLRLPLEAQMVEDHLLPQKGISDLYRERFLMIGLKEGNSKKTFIFGIDRLLLGFFINARAGGPLKLAAPFAGDLTKVASQHLSHLAETMAACLERTLAPAGQPKFAVSLPQDAPVFPETDYSVTVFALKVETFSANYFLAVPGDWRPSKTAVQNKSNKLPWEK